MASEEARSNNNKRQKRDECTTTIDCLPIDVIETVFLRLPFSTLLRCAGVCKQWRNVVQDPHFVTSQLQHAPRYTLLFFPQETASYQLYPSDAILIDQALSQSTYAVPVIGPDDFLFGSCNGLLGLYTKTSSTIKIANFSTGECLHLEKPVKNLKRDHFSLYTFGFHPATKQYKITHFLPGCIQTGRSSVIQVYTLGDKKWKDIPTPEALTLKYVIDCGLVNIEATLYWLTQDMVASCQHAIMSFDLSKETFARIQLPALLQECADGHTRRRRFWIREIDGKICIASAQTDSYMPTCHVGKLQVWILDNKMEQMWSHKYNLKYPSSDCVLGPSFLHGDNKIIIQNRDGDLCPYELSSENRDINYSKMVRLLDVAPRNHSLHSHNCVKTLVHLDVFKKAAIVRTPKQRDGWELKKWQSWEMKLSEMEIMWCKVHQGEHKETEFAQSMCTKLNRLLPRISNDVMRHHIGIKISQVLPVFSIQQARPLQRLNWVAWDMETLVNRLENIMNITMTMDKDIVSIGDMTRSAPHDQAFVQSMYTELNRIVPPKVLHGVMQHPIDMKIGQIFPAFPSQQPRSPRRLNWVEHKRDMEYLFARLENLMHITMARALAIATICDLIKSAIQYQNYSDDVDTDLRLGSLSWNSP